MEKDTPAAPRPRIPATVWALGWVSLFTDLGSEMVHALLPVLITGTLGASAVVLGLIEGAAEALVLVTKAFSGYWSDRSGRRKPLVLFGYGFAALVKPLFPLAGSVGMVAFARFADRLGKGVRGAPRDAMIGDASPPEVRGASYGLRQAMDTVGAVLGPLLAVALLWRFADDVTTVLWVAVLPGFVAVLLLVTFVREPAPAAARPARLPLSREGMRRLGAPFWAVAALGGGLALARFSEAFLVVRAAERGLPVTFVPLVLVIMSLTFALTAYPAGRLSDRMARLDVLAAGIGVLAVAHLILAVATGAGAVLAGAALWGVHMGLTQGVLASLVADTAPVELRGTAFGAFSLVCGAAVLVASAIAGLLWDLIDPAAPFWCGFVVAALVTAQALRMRVPRASEKN